jgi:hypothetical protein
MIILSVRHHSCAGPFPEELLHRYYKEYSPFDVPDAVNGFVSFSKPPPPPISHCVVFEVTEHNIENKIIFTTDFHNNFIRKC